MFMDTMYVGNPYVIKIIGTQKIFYETHGDTWFFNDLNIAFVNFNYILLFFISSDSK